MTSPVQTPPPARTAPEPAPRRSRPLLGIRAVPGRLALWVMRIPLPLYRSGRGWVLGRVFLAVTHVGRRTGTPHLTTAMVLRYDAVTEEAVVFSAWGSRTDWIRNLRAQPALQVQIGRRQYVPAQRFLDEEEAFEVAQRFIARHPWRLRLARLVVGWPDLTDDDTLRDFVRTRPFVAFRPAAPGG